jgi:hypothetical protein
LEYIRVALQLVVALGILNVWILRSGKTTPYLSIPMFLKTTPAYFAARPRLVFVGQETHGWMTDCEVTSDALRPREIMDFYQGEIMTRYRTHSRSPFSRAIRRISTEIGLEGFPGSVLTANLFPCDSKKTQAPALTLETMRGWKIVTEEIKILDPEFVVFFVGPNYASNLGCYFDAPVEPPLSSHNLLQAYRPKVGTWKGWVTYHPANLQRSKHSAVLDQLIAAIRAAGS